MVMNSMNPLIKIVNHGYGRLFGGTHEYYADKLENGYWYEKIGDRCTDRREDHLPAVNAIGIRLFSEVDNLALSNPKQPALIKWIFDIPTGGQFLIEADAITKKEFFGRKNYVGIHRKKDYQGTHVVDQYQDVRITIIKGDLQIKGILQMWYDDLFMLDSTSESAKIVKDFIHWLNENKDVKPKMRIVGDSIYD